MEEPGFTIVLRGYDRAQVDAHLKELAQRLDALEKTQTREGVVQSALEEVGQETSAILKQAHDSAAEITARSRSQAEGRLERAHREADQLTADAEERAERLERETAALWEERSRLIEEIRRFAEETLAVADDALDRVPPPRAAAPDPAEAPTEVEPPTEVTESS